MRLQSILCKAAVFAVSIFFGVQVYSAEAQSRLKFAYSSVGSMATGVWMAKESGAFDKYGIQADIIFISSGPVVVQVLEGDNAVAKNREVMGATNPADAADGTIRKLHAESIEANSVHGSDSAENAAIEIAFFFKPDEIVG